MSSPRFAPPPSSHRRLSGADVYEAAVMQAAGASIGEVAEHFGISITELEPQVGVQRTYTGARFLGPWRGGEA